MKKTISLFIIGATIGISASVYSIKNPLLEKSNIHSGNNSYVVTSTKGNKKLDDTRKTTTNLSRGISTIDSSTNSAPSQNNSVKTQTSNDVSTPKPKVEALDWWSQAQYLFPRGAVADIEDVYTGKHFKIERTMGTNHADCEALTKQDTEIIKSIWGGFSWERRPIIVTINNRRIAASMAGMPHAGRDDAPAYQVVDNLSCGYGRGQNLDVIKGNGMDGVMDVHFLNSTKHADGKITATPDSKHQQAIKISAESK